MPDPKKLQALEKIAQKLKKNHGEDFFFFSLEEGERYLVPQAIPTGIVGLDIATNLGGIPVGRAIEFYGPASGGKTTLALAVAAAFQKAGKSVLYVDAENSLSLDHALSMGVEREGFYVAQPPSGEVALNLIRDVVSEGVMDLIVLDSVPALVFQRELDGSTEDQHVALLARYMTQFTRFLNAYLTRNNVTIIFINQVREQVGASAPRYGLNEVTPGGHAIKHFASLRLSVRRSSLIKQGSGKDEKVVGHKVNVKVEKSKFGPPRSFQVDLYYGKGFDKVSHLLEIAKDFGLIQQSGAWVAYGTEKFQGLAKLAEHLSSQPEALEEMRQSVLRLALTSPSTPLDDSYSEEEEESLGILGESGQLDTGSQNIPSLRLPSFLTKAPGEDHLT